VTAGRTELTTNVVAAFDQAADAYDRNGMGGAGPIASRLVKHARLQPGWRVLDTGCGAGAVLIRAARAVSPGRPGVWR
jgi:ubiquinone/menaquinone biosynthesis C-methylase UbiE